MGAALWTQKRRMEVQQGICLRWHDATERPDVEPARGFAQAADVAETESSACRCPGKKLPGLRPAALDAEPFQSPQAAHSLACEEEAFQAEGLGSKAGPEMFLQ